MSNINICLACDENYAFLAEVAMASVMIHNKEVTIFLLSNGISQDNKNKMQNLCDRFEAHLNFIDCNEIVCKLKKIGLNPQGIFNSYSSYLRLFLVDYLPEDIDKILYIDCDVTCEASLEELFSMNLYNNSLAGVTDILPAFHKEYIGFNEDDLYFNAGVLLIDVRKWKEKEYSNKIIQVLESGRTKYPFHDQDLINIVFKNDIYRLKPNYMAVFPAYSFGKNILEKYYGVVNTYDDKAYKEAIEHPTLIHHLDNIEGRPWESNCIKNSLDSKRWIHYANLTFGINNYKIWERKTSIKTSIKRFLYKKCFYPYLVINKINRDRSVRRRCECYKGD